MGSLAQHLASGLTSALPPGWTGEREVPLLQADLVRRAGFNPRADLVLTGPDGQRIILELEISRADPVANPAKYLLAQQLGALQATDGFASLVSTHVTPDRRNQAALFTRYLRRTGLPAFQVALLPDFAPHRIQEMNQLEQAELGSIRLPFRRELKRVLGILSPLGETGGHRIHLAGDVSDVVANVWTWNDELAGPGAALWGERRIQYFVQGPYGLFAPSKFCAFIPAQGSGEARPPTGMTMSVYAQLGEQDPRFDGTVARRHLVGGLAFEEVDLSERPDLCAAFQRWHRDIFARVPLREPVRILTPPEWLRGR